MWNSWVFCFILSLICWNLLCLFFLFFIFVFSFAKSQLKKNKNIEWCLLWVCHHQCQCQYQEECLLPTLINHLHKNHLFNHFIWQPLKATAIWVAIWHFCFILTVFSCVCSFSQIVSFFFFFIKLTYFLEFLKNKRNSKLFLRKRLCH